MKGTALGNWMQHALEKDLVKLKIPRGTRNGEPVQEYYGMTFHDPDYNPGKAMIDGKTVDQREKEGVSLGLERYQAFHRASSTVPTKRHRIPLLNGACGFSSMERILNAAGYKLKYISGNKNTSTYLLE